MFFIAINSLFAYNIKVENINFGLVRITEISTFQDKIAVLGIKKYDFKSRWKEMSVVEYNNNNINELPQYYLSNGDTIKLLGSDSHGVIQYDSLGTIWINGIRMYNYTEKGWVGYRIEDDYKDMRDFLSFSILPDNSIIVTTEVYLESEHWGFSEIYKLKNGQFELLYKFDFPGSFMLLSNFGTAIATLPDNSFVFYRTRNLYENDFDTTNFANNPDFYFIKEGKTEQKYKLKVPYGKPVSDWNQTISDIYPDPDGKKIWLPLSDHIIGPDENGDYIVYGGGFTLFEDGEMTTFNENNGIVKYTDIRYENIIKIIKVSADKYLIVGSTKFYLMGKDYILQGVPLENIFDNARYFAASDFYMSENYANKIINDIAKHPDIVGIHNYRENELVLLTNVGIFIINKNNFLTATVEDKRDDNENSLYPNPAKEILTIDEFWDGADYIIFDLFGRIIQQGVIEKNNININEINEGFYLIRIVKGNSQFQTKFIKY